MIEDSKRKKSKVYRESAESWFYKNFIKNTVNDDFNTPAEILAKKTNQELIAKVENLNINNENNNNKNG